jgi:ABC-2 type transport system permease protein
MHEIVDATVAPDWAHLLPKIAAIVAGAGGQRTGRRHRHGGAAAIKGWTQFELVHYLAVVLLPQTLSALLLAVLSVFVQVLVPKKFIGWGLMLACTWWPALVLASAGFEHNLYNYGSTTPVPLSDMNGRATSGSARTGSTLLECLRTAAGGRWPGPSGGAAWSRLLRPPEGRRRRLRGWWLVAGGRLARWSAAVPTSSGTPTSSTTTITRPEREAADWADAERALLPFEKLPMPTHHGRHAGRAAVPEANAKAVTSGRYRIENRSGQPLQRGAPELGRALVLDEVTCPAPAAEGLRPLALPHLPLQPAMQPGEVRELAFRTTLQERGFPNGAPLTRLVDNGSFVDNGAITPSIGISRDAFLKDRAKRRKYGLPADLRPPTLEDESGRARTTSARQRLGRRRHHDHHRRRPGADRPGLHPQRHHGRMAAAPRGSSPRRRSTTSSRSSPAATRSRATRSRCRQEDRPGRLPPARPRIQRAAHAGGDEELARPVQRTVLALPVQAGAHPRVPELCQTSRRASPNTIPYSENIGFLTKLGEPDKIDVVTYVTAHEIAHQWWGHQLVPSSQQGGTMLVESFAQYSALLVMERLYGKEQMRRFLKYELDRYLRSRGGEVVEELPLARVENQQYIHYQKGSLVLSG